MTNLMMPVSALHSNTSFHQLVSFMKSNLLKLPPHNRFKTHQKRALKTESMKQSSQSEHAQEIHSDMFNF